MKSLKTQALLLPLAAIFFGTAAMSTPRSESRYCYFAQKQECYYDTGGYCFYGCSSYCEGDVRGQVLYCLSVGSEICCY